MILTAPVLSYLFEGVKYINSVNDGTEKLTSEDIELLDNIFQSFVYDILGLKDEGTGAGDEKLSGELMNIIIGLRQDARNKKEWGTSDKIREELKKAGIVLRDVKEGVEWHRE